MAEILIGLPRWGTVEIARCNCGAKFVVRNEDFALFDHENEHKLYNESFVTEVVHVRLPYVTSQFRRWYD